MKFFDLQRYKLFLRHDLIILLAWSAVLAWIMVNTFYHRSCTSFQSGFTQDPCQPISDFGLIFAAAAGAGLAFADERLPYIGFLIAHLAASIFFVVFVSTPVLLGYTDPALSNLIVIESMVVALRSQFPIPLIISFTGCGLGAYLGGKLGNTE